MDLRIVHNTPYVILMLIASGLFNVALQMPTPLSMMLIWIFEYYILFWVYQEYVPKSEEHSFLKALIKRSVWYLIAFLGGIIGHHLLYGHVGIYICSVYASMAVCTFLLAEHSLYKS